MVQLRGRIYGDNYDCIMATAHSPMQLGPEHCLTKNSSGLLNESYLCVEEGFKLGKGLFGLIELCAVTRNSVF
jgi:hypothetical protein